jgi:hypothetical protein
MKTFHRKETNNSIPARSTNQFPDFSSFSVSLKTLDNIGGCAMGAWIFAGGDGDLEILTRL